jgi:outer membrane protein assembly factor BamD (BamD/ComL family)
MNFLKHLFLICLLINRLPVMAQPPLNEVIVVAQKPEEFEKKVFKSEKTGKKKFTIPRRFIQNTGSHYNYWFNANEKIKNILENAKENFKDNYDELLPFYGYDLEQIAQSKQELDSVIYKSTAGILFHDLRSNWVDNFYLLIGKSYMFRKDYDSAALTFQFINYQFAQQKDGSAVTIGQADYSNIEVPSIATVEKRNIVQKVFTKPPSRNDALLWQVRNYIEAGDYGAATGLLQTLNNDKFFPQRLKADLHEQAAYLFYKLNNYDSAATRLLLAMPAAETKKDKSRWYYLYGQLKSLSKDYGASAYGFLKAIKETNDPLMEIYGRIQLIKNQIRVDTNSVNDYINALLRLTRKDDYKPYRDIIYYTLGEVSMERGDRVKAIEYFEKCITYVGNNEKIKQKAFIALLDNSIQEKKYIAAANYADSLIVSKYDTTTNGKIAEQVIYLPKLREHLLMVQINDSLLKVANLTEAERSKKIKEVSKALKKKKGIKDIALSSTPVVTDLFQQAGGSSWYFDNANLRTRGAGEFKTKWGNRPNVDNWRRKASIRNVQNSRGPSLLEAKDEKGKNNADLSAGKLLEKLEEDADEEVLLNNLPLSNSAKDSTKALIATSLYEAGKTKIYYPLDYEGGITDEEACLLIPNGKPHHEDATYLIYYAYNKLGLTDKANASLKKLQEGYPNNKMVNPAEGDKATKLYKEIYDAYISGDFEHAIQKKKEADSVYKNTYWTPQLMYIEAVYSVKTNQDSLALKQLQEINNTFPETPLANKALRLQEVLTKRKDIEAYLTNLQVEPKTLGNNNTVTPQVSRTVVTTPATVIAPTTIPVQKPVTDTVKKEVVTMPKPVVNKPVLVGNYVFDTTKTYTVMVVYNKVDVMWMGEARKAFERYNREYHNSKGLTVNNDIVADTIRVTTIANFENATKAYAYLTEIKTYSRSEILNWLTTDKYSFSLISNENLEILRKVNNWQEYDLFIRKMMPGKL